MNKKTVVKLVVIASFIMLLAGCELAKDHVHTLRFVAQKDATCAEKGNIAHYSCRECGATFSDEAGKEPVDDVSIALKSHTVDKVEAKPATLESEGNDYHWKCSECGKIFSDEARENETTLSALIIPKGFAKLYSGTVTKSIGDSDGPFINATATPVTVNAFYMALTETTYERWYEVYTWANSSERGANKYSFANQGCDGSRGTAGAAPSSEGKEPVTTISWRDAVIWCNAASEMDGKTPVYYVAGTSDFTSDKVLRVSESSSVSSGNGKAEKAVINEAANGYRLPTEAEWEYAARGGDPAANEWKYTWAGTNSESDLGNYAVYSSNSGIKTENVATKTANSAGLYDMSGNVWEWCQDIWSDSAYRVDRGGSWNFSASSGTVAYRNGFDSCNTNGNIGFRVAFSAL